MKRLFLAIVVLIAALGAALPRTAAAAVAVPAASGYGVQVGNVVVPAGTRHVGNINLAAGNVRIDGTVVGNVAVQAGNVDVVGHVTGNVSVGMGQVVLRQGSVVGGNVSVGIGKIERVQRGVPLPPVGPIGPPLSIGVTQLMLHDLPLHWPIVPFVPFGTVAALHVLWWLVGLAVVLLLSGLFAPAMAVLRDDIMQAPAATFGWGLLLVLAALPASVVLVLTIVGIPLAFVLWLAIVAAKVLGYAVVSIEFGGLVAARFGHEQTTVGVRASVGTFVLMLIGLVPVIGVVVDVLVSCLGIGAAARTGFGTGRWWFGSAPRAS